jgi:hypothetical protein
MADYGKFLEKQVKNPLPNESSFGTNSGGRKCKPEPVF